MNDIVRPTPEREHIWAILLLTAALLLAILFWMLVALPYFRFDQAHFGRFPAIFWPRRYEILLHIAGGSIALLTGPVQFWLGLTRHTKSWHRTQGKLYVAGVALGASSAYYLAITSTAQIGWIYATGLFCLALAWTVTTAMACVAIRYRAIEQHREWMIRSYVVTFAFVIFRLLIPLFGSLGVGTPPEHYTAAAWLCWAVPLLLTEPILHWRKLARRRPAVRSPLAAMGRPTS